MRKHPIFLLVGGIFSLMVAMGIGRFAYTPILPLMQADLKFTDIVAGYLASSNYSGYLIGAILVGALPLKNYRIAYLRLGLILSIITTCLMGFAHSYIFMLVIRFISGVASAFIFILASSVVLDKLASLVKTTWSGYFYSGVGFGIFFSTLFVPSFNRLFMWEGIWIGLAIISIFLTAFIWVWLKDTGSSFKESDEPKFSQTPPLKWLPYLVVAYGLEGLGYIVTGTFIVSIAEQTLNFRFDPAVVWMVVGFAAIPSCIIWSTLAKKWGFIKSLILSMTLQAIGIALPVIWLTEMSFIIGALLFGATFMGVITLTTTLGRQMSPTNSSRVIGFLTVIFAIGQMIGPTLAGFLISNSQNYNSALIGAATAVFIGAILLITGIQYERKSKLDTAVVKSS